MKMKIHRFLVALTMAPLLNACAFLEKCTEAEAMVPSANAAAYRAVAAANKAHQHSVAAQNAAEDATADSINADAASEAAQTAAASALLASASALSAKIGAQHVFFAGRGCDVELARRWLNSTNSNARAADAERKKARQAARQAGAAL